MIQIKVKVKNDQKTLTEDFERAELFLSPDSDVVKEMCEKVINDFGESVEEVIIKTKLVL